MSMPSVEVPKKNRKPVCGVGIYESGKFPGAIDRRATRLYRFWYGMLERCYSPYMQARAPHYVGCTVDPAFHRYQEFAEWASQQKGVNEDSFQLDKDILIKGNTVYSPDACSFVPKFLNTLLTNCAAARGPYPLGVGKDGRQFSSQCRFKGVTEHLGLFKTPEEAFYAYKARKEEIIKMAAEEYRNVISDRVYHALMNYQIEITD